MTILIQNNDNQKGQEQGREPPIKEVNINNIRLSGVKGALIPVKIGITSPAALVDTGTTHSCLSGAQYLEMGQAPFTALCKGTVQTATGGDMRPLGFLEYSVKIQE